MNSKQVSVIIPAYNAALYLQPAIESVLAQTYRDYEIIVIDDGSTDDTPAIAQQFGSAIRYIRQDNLGLSAARNTGIKNAETPVIALLDSDDVWEPEFLETMVGLLNQHPDAAGVYCGFNYINAEGNIVGGPSLGTVPPEVFHKTMVSVGNWLAPCSVIFYKHLAEEVGLFDEALMALEDADMWIRLSAHHPFVGLPKALVRYRKHSSNMTKDPQRMVDAGFKLTAKLFGPPEGDVLSWPQPKIAGYIRQFQTAARRYFVAGNISKSADYLLQAHRLAPDYLYGLPVWQGFALAHIPEEYQFSSSDKFDGERAYRDVEALLRELAGKPGSPIGQNGQYTKLKGVALLALADEARRNSQLRRAYAWLGEAMRRDPQIVFLRPYWGTIYRSLTFWVRR